MMDSLKSVRVPSRSLLGKVAIVTGAGCAGEGIGNGRAEAILLAADGCSVLCVDLKEELAARTAAMINEEGRGSAAVCIGDVTKPDDCKRIVDTAVAKFGRLDILVNNVAIPGPSGDVVEINMTRWQASMDVNLSSAVLMSKYAIPAMRENPGPEKGSIINLSSIAGIGGAIPHVFYSASKGAIITLTKSMALGHGKEGIRVNCVAPGSVYTPLLFSGGMDITEEVRQARIDANMLATEGTGWDTGYAVRWLSGPEARWVTGVVLPVDAGLTAIVPGAVPKYQSA